MSARAITRHWTKTPLKVFQVIWELSFFSWSFLEHHSLTSTLPGEVEMKLGCRIVELASYWCRWSLHKMQSDWVGKLHWYTIHTYVYASKLAQPFYHLNTMRVSMSENYILIMALSFLCIILVITGFKLKFWTGINRCRLCQFGRNFHGYVVRLELLDSRYSRY